MEYPWWRRNGRTDPYDVVMDCAGALSHVPSRCGYVELTRSGAQHYTRCTQPVWMVEKSSR